MKSTKPGKNPSAATPVAEAERLYCVLVKCNPTDAAPVVQSPLVEALGRDHAWRSPTSRHVRWRKATRNAYGLATVADCSETRSPASSAAARAPRAAMPPRRRAAL